MVGDAAAWLGGLDVLFNNAISYGGDSDDEGWDATLRQRSGGRLGRVSDGRAASWQSAERAPF